MLLSDLDIKRSWNTEDDNVLEDFYIKSLMHAKKYHRTTFTFSSHLLSAATQGLDGLISNNGSMKLMIGDRISEEDYMAIKEGADLQKYQDQCLERLKSVLSYAKDNPLYHHRLEILKYMIASSKLEVKFALMHKGDKIFHPKLGIIYGENDEKIVFSGSGNETKGGVDLNWETFDVYRSWDKDIYEYYGQDKENNFLKFWSQGSSKSFRLITLPDDELISIVSKNLNSKISLASKPDPKEINLLKNYKQIPAPEVPSKINGHKFQIRDYQSNALRNWWEHRKGILEHATGSGKTLTAIYGITKIFQKIEDKNNLIAIISVPYQILADQWSDELKLFNINAIKCYGDSKKWISKVKNRIAEAEMSSKKELISLVVVIPSLFGNKFEEVNEIIEEKKIRTIFVGDECHELATRNLDKLPKAMYKMGLSATPFVERDDPKTITKNNNLKSYFGEIVDKFTLADALEKDYLCPYEYHPIFIQLNEDEQDEYLKLSQQIAACMEADDDRALKILNGMRARLLGSAEEKFIKLKSLAVKLNKPHNTIVFCGDGKTEESLESEIKDKIKVLKILRELDWDVSEFTAEVNSRVRKVRIQDFKDQDLNALVAIKVLDQGVNIPAITTAIILASTRSKRQYIQRLGRVLRKSQNKDISYIYDFIVMPRNNQFTALSESLQNLIENELVRFHEFVKCAKNKQIIENKTRKYMKENFNYVPSLENLITEDE